MARNNWKFSISFVEMCPGGEIGRRNGLKIIMADFLPSVTKRYPAF